MLLSGVFDKLQCVVGAPNMKVTPGIKPNTSRNQMEQSPKPNQIRFSAFLIQIGRRLHFPVFEFDVGAVLTQLILLLRVCDAMSGTEIASAATSSGAWVTRSWSQAGSSIPCRSIVLCSRYAMSAINVCGFQCSCMLQLRVCSAMPGTDFCYAAASIEQFLHELSIEGSGQGYQPNFVLPIVLPIVLLSLLPPLLPILLPILQPIAVHIVLPSVRPILLHILLPLLLPVVLHILLRIRDAMCGPDRPSAMRCPVLAPPFLVAMRCPVLT
eukprot:3374115-Rhodomonas_salina.2